MLKSTMSGVGCLDWDLHLLRTPTGGQNPYSILLVGTILVVAL